MRVVFFSLAIEGIATGSFLLPTKLIVDGKTFRDVGVHIDLKPFVEQPRAFVLSHAEIAKATVNQ